MKQTDWKIVYADYEGMTKRAAEFLSGEAGKYIVREEGVYRLHVLPCEKEGCAVENSAFVVGLYSESAFVRKFVKEEEIAPGGFLVKVIKNPACESGRLVILTAHTPNELYAAAVSFVDDYIPAHAPAYGAVRMPQYIFDQPLPLCSYTERPAFKTRSVFTWGHSINDYREYIKNLARLGFNRVIVWNDHVPVNMRDFIAFAHSFGIEVVCGYAWGWIDGCCRIADIGSDRLKSLRRAVLREYQEKYADLGCDGIYFQSFTERSDEYIGGRQIASAVADFVNETAGTLLAKQPGLKLQFGLHATSVKNHLEEIGRVDKSVDILWEDCGEFPYSYWPAVTDENKFKETLEFTEKILSLRGGAGVGLVFKGVMMLDWTKFVNQRGPYVLGENARETAGHDKRLRRGAWRIFSAEWMQYGAYAAKMLQFIAERAKGGAEMCLAGTFDGGIWLPQALCAQLFRTPHAEYGEILKRVARRGCVTV